MSIYLVVSIIINIGFIGYYLGRFFLSKKNSAPNDVHDYVREGIDHQDNRIALFSAMLALSARIANADGQILPSEKQVVTTGLGIDQSGFEFSASLFSAALESDVSNEEVASVISKVYKTDREKLAVVNFLEQIAIADGEYHDKEKKLIAEIRDMLGV